MKKYLIWFFLFNALLIKAQSLKQGWYIATDTKLSYHLQKETIDSPFLEKELIFMTPQYTFHLGLNINPKWTFELSIVKERIWKGVSFQGARFGGSYNTVVQSNHYSLRAYRILKKIQLLGKDMFINTALAYRINYNQNFFGGFNLGGFRQWRYGDGGTFDIDYPNTHKVDWGLHKFNHFAELRLHFEYAFTHPFHFYFGGGYQQGFRVLGIAQGVYRQDGGEWYAYRNLNYGNHWMWFGGFKLYPFRFKKRR